MTTDTTGEVFVLCSKAHPSYVYVGWEPSVEKRMDFLRRATPNEDNYRYSVVRRVPDPEYVVKRTREALHERNSPSEGWFEIEESAAVALLRMQITIWFESPKGDR